VLLETRELSNMNIQGELEQWTEERSKK
jgi:hypothetical protein